MMDSEYARIKEAVSRGQNETIAAAVDLAREWAEMIETNGLAQTGPEALRFFADTIEKQWAATGAGVSHAAE